MEESILKTIKKLLGVLSTDTVFDEDLFVNINSSFMTLNQLGVGPESVFSIDSDAATWADFLATDMEKYSAVKTFVWLKVRLVFDPPGTSFLLDAIQKQISELEWRLAVQVPIPDPVPPVEP